MGSKTRDGLYRRGKVWWLRTDPVTGKPTSTKCERLEDAREFRASRIRLAGSPSYATAEKRAREERLVDWAAKLVALKRRQGRNAEFFLQKLAHWPRLLSGADRLPEERRADAVRSVRLFDVDPDSVDRCISARRVEGATDHTITKEFGVLRQVMTLAWRAGAYHLDPAKLRPLDLTSSYRPRERALPMEEVRALLPHLSGPLAVVVTRCVSLGTRLSEALAMGPQHFDWEHGVAQVPGTKTERSRRTVALLSVFSELLELASSSGPLAKPNNLYRDLQVACRRAGIETCTPNDLRRSYATILREAGVSERDTADLLGHASVAMVRRVYARPRAAELGKRIERQLGACNENVASTSVVQRSPSVSTAIPRAKKAHPGMVRVWATGFLSRRSHVRIVPGALLTNHPAPPAPRAGAESLH